MGHSALGAADLDLPEHALLLNGICFFPLWIKDVRAVRTSSTLLWPGAKLCLMGSSGLVSSVSNAFMVGGVLHWNRSGGLWRKMNTVCLKMHRAHIQMQDNMYEFLYWEMWPSGVRCQVSAVWLTWEEAEKGVWMLWTPTCRYVRLYDYLRSGLKASVCFRSMFCPELL